MRSRGAAIFLVGCDLGVGCGDILSVDEEERDGGPADSGVVVDSGVDSGALGTCKGPFLVRGIAELNQPGGEYVGSLTPDELHFYYAGRLYLSSTRSGGSDLFVAERPVTAP